MLTQRLLVVIILLPLGMFVIHLGGITFAVLMALILGLAAWEYVHLFRLCSLYPSAWLVVGGSLLILVGRVISAFENTPLIISFLALAAMTHHLVAYERGRSQAATDFAVTLAGLLYIGWLGAYLISLRELPDGKWWFLVVFPSVWLADSAAYFVGRRYGNHPLSPRLSPKKTWEGYLAGILGGTLSGALFGILWRIGAGPQSAITAGAGAILGFVLSAITPLGDLGESMIKRQAGQKDSSHLLPGHGGAFDRIDSWLWAAPIGYYLIILFFQ